MEAIRNLVPEGLEGLPMSVQVIGATILLGLLYSYVTRNKAWPQFPLISINGLGPRKSWMLHGREVLKEGLQRVH